MAELIVFVFFLFCSIYVSTLNILLMCVCSTTFGRRYTSLFIIMRVVHIQVFV